MPVDPVTGGEPVVGGVVAANTVKNAVARLLGPAADEIAEALARYTGFRLRNVGRIAANAEAKSDRTGRTGQVPPRVAHALLSEGSYCDDDVMVEYLGGVLAASRTPDGRDDRAVTWSATVARLSARQVRAHYVLYREWARLLQGRTDLNLGLSAARSQATLCVPLGTYIAAIASDGLSGATAVTDTIPALTGAGLLGDPWAAGTREESTVRDAPFDLVVVVEPSITGFELYGWAMGLPKLGAGAIPASGPSFRDRPGATTFQSRVSSAYAARCRRRTGAMIAGRDVRAVR